MAPTVETPDDLEPGEREVGRWPAEPVSADGKVGRTGWILLTDRRLRFYASAGRLHPRRLLSPASVALPLEGIGALARREYSMEIGYGDRVRMEGLVVQDRGLRLRRDQPSRPILDAVERARNERRAALGLPLR